MTTDQQIHDAVDGEIGYLPPLSQEDADEIRSMNSPGPAAGWLFIVVVYAALFLIFLA